MFFFGAPSAPPRRARISLSRRASPPPDLRVCESRALLRGDPAGGGSCAPRRQRDIVLISRHREIGRVASPGAVHEINENESSPGCCRAPYQAAGSLDDLFLIVTWCISNSSSPQKRSRLYRWDFITFSLPWDVRWLCGKAVAQDGLLVHLRSDTSVTCSTLVPPNTWLRVGSQGTRRNGWHDLRWCGGSGLRSFRDGGSEGDLV